MHQIDFNRDEEGMKALAVFIAQIVREGITYKIVNHDASVSVEILGGF